MTVHDMAFVSPGAKLDSSVSVGPFSFIGPDVEIGAGTVIGPNAVVKGPSTIGRNNRIFQFASIGEDCQDKKYRGEPTTLIVGDDNIFRENCSVHRGTVQDKGETRIGDRNLFMASSHLAHDCVVGNDVILANLVAVAGHVVVDDFAILGGGSLIHQFCHVGAHSMCAGGSIVLKDVPAFIMASGQSATAHGLNSEGLRRRGFEADTVSLLKKAYRVLYRSGLSLEKALEELDVLKAANPSAALETFIASLRRSERGIVR